MPEFTALYRIHNGTDFVPFFLLISPRGGFSQVFASALKAGSVARIEDSIVEVALAGEVLSLFIKDLMEARQVTLRTCNAIPFGAMPEPGGGRVYELELQELPMLHFGVDELGICRTAAHRDSQEVFGALGERDSVSIAQPGHSST